MQIIVSKNYQVMSKLAAQYAIAQIKRKPNSVIGLATGETQEGFYQELIKAYKNKLVNFKQVRTFNLDEYIGLNGKDKNSYHFYMKEKFFKHVNLTKANIHVPNGLATALDQECKDYERNIRKSGGIDLLFLGLGLNGHIGFNEPGSSIKSKTRLVNLTLSTRRANAVFFNHAVSRVPSRALTMGLATIMRAKKIILLASGRDKAEIVCKAIKGRINSQVPVSILQKHPDVVAILDYEAAGKMN